jgi:hypothetical protein
MLTMLIQQPYEELLRPLTLETCTAVWDLRFTQH